MEITLEQAIVNIGIALGHESLRLSQAEHLSLIKSYEMIKKALEEQKELPKEDINLNIK